MRGDGSRAGLSVAVAVSCSHTLARLERDDACAEAIRVHPDQDTLKATMIEAGFDRVDYHNLAAGIVALHIGRVY